jgi:heterodisulfide reductase subunit A-like polyferredoxin
MKATIESAGNNNNNMHLSSLRGQEGKVHKPKHHHKEEENEEIKAYLTKLQELVPFMPKNRK